MAEAGKAGNDGSGGTVAGCQRRRQKGEVERQIRVISVIRGVEDEAVVAMVAVGTQKSTVLDLFSFPLTSKEGCVKKEKRLNSIPSQAVGTQNFLNVSVCTVRDVTRYLKKHKLLGQRDGTRLLASQ